MPFLKHLPFPITSLLSLPRTFQEINAKGFYLLLHSIAVRTLLLSPIDLKPENLKKDKYLKQSIDIHLQANYTNVLVNESTLNIIYHHFTLINMPINSCNFKAALDFNVSIFNGPPPR